MLLSLISSFVLMAPLAFGQVSSLQRKRVIHATENEDIPSAQKRIKEYLGMSTPPEFAVDWASSENRPDDAFFSMKNYVGKVTNAIEFMSRDAMAKDLLGQSLKKIVIKHNPAVNKQLSYADGVFTTETNFEDVYKGVPSDNDVIRAIENGL